MRAIFAAIGLAGLSVACETSGNTEGQRILSAMRTCKLVMGATFSLQRKALTLNLPTEFYPKMDKTATAGKIGCFKQWAREQGYQLTVEQTRS